MLLDKQQTKYNQKVTGTFLYYARVVDSAMLMALSVITMERGAPMITTMKNTQQFLDYAAANNEVVITYKASNVTLAVHSDASYLYEP